jgi:hypothetical protein
MPLTAQNKSYVIHVIHDVLGGTSWRAQAACSPCSDSVQPAWRTRPCGTPGGLRGGGRGGFRGGGALLRSDPAAKRLACMETRVANRIVRRQRCCGWMRCAAAVAAPPPRIDGLAWRGGRSRTSRRAEPRFAAAPLCIEGRGTSELVRRRCCFAGDWWVGVFND